MKYRIKDLDKEFSNLAKDNKLNISAIEELAIKNIDDYKDFIHRHIEELIKQGVEEKKLIVKKNKNRKIVDIISVTKEEKE